LQGLENEDELAIWQNPLTDERL